MPQVCLCLGSNAENAGAMLAAARRAIAALPDIRPEKASPIYFTEPQDYADQPWFQNQVLLARAGQSWTHITLMRALLRLEADLGRRRGANRFGPRAIDLDMLLYGDTVSSDPVCVLPHPRLVRRAFALVPLRDVAPCALIAGKTAEQWLAELAWRLDGCKIFQ